MLFLYFHFLTLSSLHLPDPPRHMILTREIFVPLFWIILIDAQNINVSKPIIQTPVNSIRKIVYDRTTGGFYAAGYHNSMIRFDSSFNMIWEKFWTGAGGVDGAGTRTLAVHASGDVITCSEGFIPINGVGTVTESTWTQYAVMRVKPDSNIVTTVMYGGTNYDWCNDVAMSYDLTGNYYYHTGYKKGDFITPAASTTGYADTILVKYNFANSAIIWAVALSGQYSVSDWGLLVAEVNSWMVQVVVARWNDVPQTSNFDLVSFNPVNGFRTKTIVLPFTDYVNGYFDNSTSWWWFITNSKKVYGIDINGKTQFVHQLASPLPPVVFAVDYFNANIFVGYQDISVMTIKQYGILSGKIFEFSWKPDVSTQNFGGALLQNSNLVIGGDAFARFFPNVTFMDSCPNGLIRNKLICEPCVVGTFWSREVDDSGTCKSCPYASYCPDGTSIRFCGDNSNTTSTGSFDASFCICNAGYYGTNGSCTICPAKSFCVGGTEIAKCPDNSNSKPGSSLCTCNSGTYISSDQSCQVLTLSVFSHPLWGGILFGSIGVCAIIMIALVILAIRNYRKKHPDGVSTAFSTMNTSTQTTGFSTMNTESSVVSAISACNMPINLAEASMRKTEDKHSMFDSNLIVSTRDKESRQVM